MESNIESVTKVNERRVFLFIMDLEQEMLENLKNMKLTTNEEDDIIETNEQLGKVYHKCTLNLFGRFLSTKSFNRKAAKDILKSIWRMGPDFRIVEVGNEILHLSSPQTSREGGFWRMAHGVLITTCSPRMGEKMSSQSLTFTHSPFWMQVWGLPFDLCRRKQERR